MSNCAVATILHPFLSMSRVTNLTKQDFICGEIFDSKYLNSYENLLKIVKSLQVNLYGTRSSYII